jgi:hypothetical protein
MSTYDKLNVLYHALNPVHVFSEKCVDVWCRSSMHIWSIACHTHCRKRGCFCSLNLQRSTRVTLKIKEKNIDYTITSSIGTLASAPGCIVVLMLTVRARFGCSRLYRQEPPRLQQHERFIAGKGGKIGEKCPVNFSVK